jgi:hypothetical protein
VLLVVVLSTAVATLVSPVRALDSGTVPDGIAYLASQQIPGTDPATGSGAWDASADFPFVTYDAVLAIGQSAQTTNTWSTTEAFDAVAAFENADGQSPLEFLDLMASGSISAGRAGKIAVLLAGPLGLPYSAYDPAADGSPVDLVAAVGSPSPDGSYDLFFNNTLYAALASELFTGSIPASTVTYIEACQQPAGGWAFDCTDATDPDVDTTALAVQTLVAGGKTASDDSVRNGLGYLAHQLGSDGIWSAFGSPSVESSSRAMLAITAAGFDVNSPCWRDTVASSLTSAPFTAADDAVESFAQPDGSIAGPGAFSVPYATAQALTGLLRSWFPTVVAAAQNCAVPGTPPMGATPSPVVGVTATGSDAPTPRFTG